MYHEDEETLGARAIPLHQIPARRAARAGPRPCQASSVESALAFSTPKATLYRRPAKGRVGDSEFVSAFSTIAFRTWHLPLPFRDNGASFKRT